VCGGGEGRGQEGRGQGGGSGQGGEGEEVGEQEVLRRQNEGESTVHSTGTSPWGGECRVCISKCVLQSGSITTNKNKGMQLCVLPLDSVVTSEACTFPIVLNIMFMAWHCVHGMT
jgi:hypothetical protein